MSDTITGTQQQLAGIPIPKDVEERRTRGRKAMRRDAPKRRLCMRFERGDTYWYINDKGLLSFQPTVTSVNGGGKPPHRIRNKYNFIRPIVEAKISAATQRIPGYEVHATATDPDKISAAKLSQKAAYYAYDKLRLRKVRTKVVKLAIAGGGEGFAMPYFDPSIGPFVPMPDGSAVGQGEIRVMTLSGNEVYWENGIDFEDSRWFVIERAVPVEEIEGLPGFVGGKITPDATTSDIPTDRRDRENLAILSDYLERPSQKYPLGRRVTIANGQVVVDCRLLDPTCESFWEPYPLVGTDNQPIDEPVLHRLTYSLDPENDRDFGLVWQLIDAQRTIQDCWNKLLEWKNRCLNPQKIAAANSIVGARPDDSPGAVLYYRMGMPKPEWETPPPVPQALFEMLSAMKADMRAMAADDDFSDQTIAAARTVQAVLEQAQNRWGSFLGDLAEFDSRLMRHVLLLMARHYSEPRLLRLRGRFGPEMVQSFQGAQLLDQIDVTVLPETLVTRSKQDVQDRITWVATTFPGWLSPEIALAALDGGEFEDLICSYEYDVARCNRIIQAIRDGTVMSMPERPDQQTMLDGTTQTVGVPTWMPDDNDNLAVWKAVFGDWMKTEDFEQLPEPMQEVGRLIWQGIKQKDMQQKMAQVQQQNAIAGQLGLENATRPAQAKGMPSQPQQNPPAQPSPAAS